MVRWKTLVTQRDWRPECLLEGSFPFAIQCKHKTNDSHTTVWKFAAKKSDKPSIYASFTMYMKLRTGQFIHPSAVAAQMLKIVTLARRACLYHRYNCPSHNAKTQLSTSSGEIDNSKNYAVSSNSDWKCMYRVVRFSNEANGLRI